MQKITQDDQLTGGNDSGPSRKLHQFLQLRPPLSLVRQVAVRPELDHPPVAGNEQKRREATDRAEAGAKQLTGSVSTVSESSIQ